MGLESERLEREAADLRRQLQRTIEELHGRITFARAIDQGIAFLRRGPAEEFFRDIADAARRSPIPLVLIGLGIVWIAAGSRKAAGVGAATSAGGKRDAAARLAATKAVSGGSREVPGAAAAVALEMEFRPLADLDDSADEPAELDGASDVLFSEEA
jgi:hypothetical protein